MSWVDIKDEMPKPGRYVLATYKNGLNKDRIVKAVYYERYQVESNPDFNEMEQNDEYCSERDAYYIRPGWYECIDNWDDYSEIVIHQGQVTHWMPLPMLPVVSSKKEQATT